MPVLNLTAIVAHSHQRRKECDESASTGYMAGLIIMGLLFTGLAVYALWHRTHFVHTTKAAQDLVARYKEQRATAKTTKAKFNLMLKMAHKEKAALEEENQKLRRQICRIPMRVRTGAEKIRDRNIYPTAAAPVDKKKPEVVEQQRQKQQQKPPVDNEGYWGVYETPYPDSAGLKSPGALSMYCSGGSGDDDRGRAETRHQAKEISGRQSRQSSRKLEGNRKHKTGNRSLSQTPSSRSAAPIRTRCLTISTAAPTQTIALSKPPIGKRRYSEQTHRRPLMEDKQGCIENSEETRCLQPEKYKGVARQDSVERKKENKSEWPFQGGGQDDLDTHAPVSLERLAGVNKILTKKEINEFGSRQKSTKVALSN
ncbi:hypothetical protein EDB81DRAFT_881130 [Dactylonectria macrodidyma]|uniref:Uncharacterized protein n=1 Tax=Dactylonectria macrodidyma TaxID=307937 RepID=A0A9P9F7H4_9HYPO|nr:hypothetical protein EDB81DRAFT_881130 [Dactylonectria macrodidyma]